MKLISVVASCYNEELNLDELYSQIKNEFEKLKKYEFELILVDNCSTDNTAGIIRTLAKKDKRVKGILNSRNFGHIRSPFYALIQGRGDSVVLMASDLQDPPKIIPEFISKWESGSKIVLAVKTGSQESWIMSYIRKAYYSFIKRIADDEVDLVKNFTGFGLYDKKIVDI